MKRKRGRRRGMRMKNDVEKDSDGGKSCIQRSERRIYKEVYIA
jgi:hypothetical protein